MKNSINQSNHFQHALLSLSRICKYLFILAVTLSFQVLRTQSLDDFKTSASYDKGIETIPFSSLRSSAGTIASEVQNLKQEYANASDLKTFTLQKRKLLYIVMNSKKKIKEAEEKLAEYEFQLPEWVNDKEEANKTLDQANRDLNDLNDKMKEVVNKLDKLIEARKLLYDKFKEVLSELNNAKSNPSKYIGDNPSEDDVRSLNSYIDEIVENIERENESHSVERSNEEKAKTNLQDVINKTEYWK